MALKQTSDPTSDPQKNRWGWKQIPESSEIYMF